MPGTDNAGAHEFRKLMRPRQAIVPDGDAYVARAEFLRLVPGAILHMDNCP